MAASPGVKRQAASHGFLHSLRNMPDNRPLTNLDISRSSSRQTLLKSLSNSRRYGAVASAERLR
jgi:hypothetical protein